MKLEPCKKCGCTPKVVCIDGLYYVQCSGRLKKNKTLPSGETQDYMVNCDKWRPYEFLGTTEKRAIENWNVANTTGRLYDDEI